MLQLEKGVRVFITFGSIFRGVINDNRGLDKNFRMSRVWDLVLQDLFRSLF